jgi:hypothetical protein
MVRPCAMFTLVIGQIFLSRVPAEFVHILGTLDSYPEKLEFDIHLVFLVGIGQYFPGIYHTDTRQI